MRINVFNCLQDCKSDNLGVSVVIKYPDDSEATFVPSCPMCDTTMELSENFLTSG